MQVACQPTGATCNTWKAYAQNSGNHMEAQITILYSRMLETGARARTTSVKSWQSYASTSRQVWLCKHKAMRKALASTFRYQPLKLQWCWVRYVHGERMCYFESSGEVCSAIPASAVIYKPSNKRQADTTDIDYISWGSTLRMTVEGGHGESMQQCLQLPPFTHRMNLLKQTNHQRLGHAVWASNLDNAILTWSISYLPAIRGRFMAFMWIYLTC